MAEPRNDIPATEYHGFAGTINPKGGINSDEWQDRLLVYLKKNCDQWKVVLEEPKGPESRHFHFGIIMKKPMSVGNVNQSIRRFFKHLIKSSNSNANVCVLMRRWYKGSGWEEYMDKDDDREVIFTNVDGDIRDMLLWPHIPKDERKRKVAWQQMNALEILWKEEREHNPVKEEDCMQFLNEMAYAKRKISLPSKSGKEARALSVHLFRYINKYRGSHCIDDTVDEMRQGIGGPAMAPGFCPGRRRDDNTVNPLLCE